MKRFITIVLAVVVVSGMGVSQAKADSKNVTGSRQEKTTVRPGVDSVNGYGRYYGHSGYYGTYYSPYTTYYEPSSTYYSPYWSYYSPSYSYHSHYSHYSHGSRR
jgi:hypothetical protein